MFCVFAPNRDYMRRNDFSYFGLARPQSLSSRTLFVLSLLLLSTHLKSESTVWVLSSYEFMVYSSNTPTLHPQKIRQYMIFSLI